MVSLLKYQTAEEIHGQRILKLVDTSFSCSSGGHVLLYTHSNYHLSAQTVRTLYV